MIAKAEFGRTGHKSTRVIFGAAALGSVSQKVADETLDVLLEHGVNHIDTAASYGESELRIAPWWKREPGRFFLAHKTGKRDEKAAREDLDRFDFDSVLLPYNFITMQNDYYRANFEALEATCRDRRVAVQTIKSIAHRPWMEHEHTRTTWYQPLESPDDIDLAVWWTLGRPGVFLNSVGDVNLLPLVLDAAERFSQAPGDDQMRELMDRSLSIPLFV